MTTLEADFKAGLFDNHEGPCLSLYQPTHRHGPENQQDPIRFGNLVKALEESLLQQVDKRTAQAMLEPFEALADDRVFWNHSQDGLAVLSAKDFLRVYKLQRPIAELAVVADTFHLKPLWRIVQSADRYQVLGLNRKEMKLYEGNRDALDEITPSKDIPRTLVDALGSELTEPHTTVTSHGGTGQGTSPMFTGHGGKEAELDIDTERFFRVVDRGVLDFHSRPSGMPLILAALPEYHHMFHEVSRNPHLVAESIDIHPDALSSIDELRQRAWEVIAPHYLAKLAALVEEFGTARARELGDDDPEGVAKAILEGRVATLLVEADREIPGRIDRTTGGIAFEDLGNPGVDDVLDDLGEMAMKMGGKIVIVPTERMPTETGVAAIYRY